MDAKFHPAMAAIRSDKVTPKAFANYSPGLERQRQPWEPHNNSRVNPERVIPALTLTELIVFFIDLDPKVVASLQPLG